MKYKVMLVNDAGETVDESAEAIPAKNAILLIEAWEGVISHPTRRVLDSAECLSCGHVFENLDCPYCNSLGNPPSQ